MLVVAVAVMTAGCDMLHSGERLVDSKGLSLYWGHRVFHEQGRGYVFEFYEEERSDNLYELKFEYQIDNETQNIGVRLIGKVDKGPCPRFPSPGPNPTDYQCTSKGSIYIPEGQVNEGDYGFIVSSLNYSVRSELRFAQEKATLHIPPNDYFSSSIQDVFIAPENLLSGTIVLSGEENLASGWAFIEDLRSLGLRDTVVTNPPLIKVDEKGIPVVESWPPDEYSIPFLLTLTVDFSTVFELAKVHFDKSDLNIYLYSTNGDEARLNHQGIRYSE